MKTKRPKYLLALDAGFSHLGCVVVDLATEKAVLTFCIVTEPESSKESVAQGNARRCKEIAYQLEKLIKQYRVCAVSAELPSGGAQSSRAMSHMSMATACIAVVCALMRVPLFPVTPRQIKCLVSPTGKAEKEEVAAVVEKFYKKEFPRKLKIREHICDAGASYIVARKVFSTEISAL